MALSPPIEALEERFSQVNQYCRAYLIHLPASKAVWNCLVVLFPVPVRYIPHFALMAATTALFFLLEIVAFRLLAPS